MNDSGSVLPPRNKGLATLATVPDGWQLGWMYHWAVGSMVPTELMDVPRYMAEYQGSLESDTA